MIPHSVKTRVRAFLEYESTRPDLGRAWRAMLAVTLPLLLNLGGWLPLNVTFVVLAAQNVAMVDVRGSYGLRISLLLAMTAILAGAASLGTVAAFDVRWAVLGAGLIAAGGGMWRHLTPDYGASLAISSTLLYLIAVSWPGPPATVESHGLAALAGGLVGLLLQVANWPINPQHPLRRTVATSWLAVADLFEALAPLDPGARSQRVLKCEAQLRTTLDQTYAALALARPSALRTQLEELNLAAARLATRVVALNTALETVLAEPQSAWLAQSLRPILTSLTNTSRSVAVTVVSRQPAHLVIFEVRLRRLTNLLRAFQSQTPARLAHPATAAHLREILRQIEHHLPNVLAIVRGTVDRADERAAFSLELFDLQTWTLRPLAAALNLNRRFDPALLRFTARVTVLTMLGVAAFKLLDLPHGYWLPLTMVIVLQPDYGSTRERAAQRLLGTLAGSLAASALLWLHPPFAAVTVATAATMFAFAYFVKRHYAIAVVFITVFVVLLTEAHEPVTWWFTLERIASTVVGGTVALIAALVFWPVWERDRLPPVLAAALEANRDYLRMVAVRFAEGGAYDAPVIALKRHAESANSAVFSSLQRMMADPRHRQAGLEQVAAQANGNQRITRACTVLALHLKSGAPLRLPELDRTVELAAEIFDRIAAQLRGAGEFPALAATANVLQSLTFDESSLPPVADAGRSRAAFAQCAVIATELGALLLAIDPAEREPTTSNARLTSSPSPPDP